MVELFTDFLWDSSEPVVRKEVGVRNGNEFESWKILDEGLDILVVQKGPHGINL